MIELRVLAGTCVLELKYSAEKLFLGEGAVVQLEADEELRVIQQQQQLPQQPERLCHQEMRRRWCDKVSDLLSSQKY
ncbi:hypothetical protein QSV34_00105 [Porticoccus sp. W117]|uniref:hypothetical protein n=1 Tax=Porticoccus sp. W117 TaxID=3054777 RepID=UPI00259AA593|nr:hypothetical protein [Porticoccus sp. W117]MDM3869743.1 hypothetical protein [Porticoccus sp. W117]